MLDDTSGITVCTCRAKKNKDYTADKLNRDVCSIIVEYFGKQQAQILCQDIIQKNSEDKDYISLIRNLRILGSDIVSLFPGKGIQSLTKYTLPVKTLKDPPEYKTSPVAVLGYMNARDVHTDDPDVLQCSMRYRKTRLFSIKSIIPVIIPAYMPYTQTQSVNFPLYLFHCISDYMPVSVHYKPRHIYRRLVKVISPN